MSSLKFGTSGLRGLAAELEGAEARRYVWAFLRHMKRVCGSSVTSVYLAADFRPSSTSILRDCASAIASAGLVPVDCGAIPTPALAQYAMAQGGAAIMVTGSHIPADRNGLKFYLPSGEISKADEVSIVDLLGVGPSAIKTPQCRDEGDRAETAYRERLADLLPRGALSNQRIGVFQHSTVSRDMLAELMRFFGATVIPLGRREDFVSVDTEAFDDPIFAPMAGWVGEFGLDAIVSADGDGDRPLLMDNVCQFVRGDALGVISSRFLNARTVVTPGTSNSAIEDTGYFAEVVRTRVGSPHVIAAMAQAGGGSVVGFEAKGGTFIGEGVKVRGRPLPPLATRDAILPLLCGLGTAAAQGKSLQSVQADLPLRAALAGRLQDVPNAHTAAFLMRLQNHSYAAKFFEPMQIAGSAAIDGLQFWTGSGSMVHFRASGNAPELRCYVEAETTAAATKLLEWSLRAAAEAVGSH